MVGKFFRSGLFRSLKNGVVSQKIEFIYFYPCSQAKLSRRFLPSLPNQRIINHSPQETVFENQFSPTKKEGEERAIRAIMSKIKLVRVLVTSFDKSHHLSSTLKYEGSLT